MYDLLVQGYRAFARTTLFDQRSIALDPLAGRLTGTNRVFRTGFFPLLTSGSLTVTDSSGSVLSGVADYNTGVVTLDGVPALQPLANYTYTPLTTTQTTQVLIRGFEDMELRFPRNWKLVTAQGGPLAIESSLAILVADSTGSNPNCNGILFDASPLQMAFLHLCTRFAYLSTQHDTAAITDYSYKESRGTAIDKSRRPGNLNDLLRRLNGEIEGMLPSVQEDFYGGANYGGAVVGPFTTDYLENFYWQDDARVNLGVNLRVF
jgi:hypothetical protein